MNANYNSHIAFSSILLMQNANLNFFIKHFLVSRILYEKSTLINFGFRIKKALICGFNFKLYKLERLQYFHSDTKF